MKEIVNFLFRANKLKETQRTGWIIWRVKNPESIAEHIFRVAFLSYLLGWKKIKSENGNSNGSISRFMRSLCRRRNPSFLLSKSRYYEKKDREILLKGIRLSSSEKKKMSKIKFENEKNLF